MIDREIKTKPNLLDLLTVEVLIVPGHHDGRAALAGLVIIQLEHAGLQTDSQVKAQRDNGNLHSPGEPPRENPVQTPQ